MNVKNEDNAVSDDLGVDLESSILSAVEGATKDVAFVIPEDDAVEEVDDDAGNIEQVDVDDEISLADVVASKEMDSDATDGDEQPNNSEDTMFLLPTGDEVSLEELLDGYMRQADYTRKRQQESDEVKNLKKELAEANNLAKLVDEDPMFLIRQHAKSRGVSTDEFISNLGEDLDDDDDYDANPANIAEIVNKAVAEALSKETALESLKQLQAEKELREQTEQVFEQATAEFEKIESELSVTISNEDRIAILQEVQRRGSRVEDIDLVYTALDKERKDLEARKRLAKETAVTSSGSTASERNGSDKQLSTDSDKALYGAIMAATFDL